jgi:hypothetical protein
MHVRTYILDVNESNLGRHTGYPDSLLQIPRQNLLSPDLCPSSDRWDWDWDADMTETSSVIPLTGQNHINNC